MKKAEEPLVLAKRETDVGLVEANEGLDLMRSLLVTNDEEQEFAAEILRDVKAKHAALEKRRKAITVPINTALKEVNDLFRPVRQALEEAERLLKGKIAGYLELCEERNAAALKAASSAATTEDAEAALTQHAPVTAPAGVNVRYSWEFEITEPAKVPKVLWSPDPAKVEAELQASLQRAGKPPEIPGVTFTKKPIVTARQVRR